MSRKRTVVAAAAALAGALTLAACGSAGTEAGGATGNCDTSKGTLVVGFDAPLSGSLSALGLGMKNSADLAVKQANQQCSVPGYKLDFQAEDDQATPQVGGQATTKLASDPNVVAVIGPLNSSVAQTMQPLLAAKNILQISPANTNPTLTRGQDYVANPKRPFPTYFRTAATDDLQGPFAAEYLVKKAGKKKIAVVDDGKTYGVGLAKEFAAQAKKDGATIVAQERVGEKDTDFSGVIAKIKPSAPDAVYYGGEYPVAGPLSKQFTAAGLDIPLMGGDGIVNADFVKLGGKEGDLATNVGPAAEKLASAKSFLDAYAAAGYTEPSSAYGALTYDAANTVIKALAATVADGGWSDAQRVKLLANAGKTDFQGATGEVKFDAYGDTVNKLLTVYKVEGGDFTALETGTFQK
jgi:branched-chain amino acid transport system substrate-binding protein